MICPHCQSSTDSGLLTGKTICSHCRREFHFTTIAIDSPARTLGPLRNASLQVLQDEIGTWTDATFPEQTVSGKINHLALEVDELKRSPADLEEMADIFIIILDIARLNQFDSFQLMAAACQKLDKCKQRKWHPADKNGVFHHIT